MGIVEISLLIILAVGLVAISVFDIRTMRIPDLLSIPLILFGLIWAEINNRLADGLIGALVGFAAFWLVAKIYQKLRNKTGLGLGDAKLLAVGGAWCGWQSLPIVVLVGSASAILAVLWTSWLLRLPLSRRIAFGPFLCLGIAVATFMRL